MEMSPLSGTRCACCRPCQGLVPFCARGWH